MKRRAQVAPENSVVLVMDSSAGTVPAAYDGGLIAATASCVVVGTRAQHEGKTAITLTDDQVPTGMGLDRAFQGDLETPSGVLGVYTVVGEAIIEVTVSCDRVGVAIYVNDHNEPDVITIHISH